MNNDGYPFDKSLVAIIHIDIAYEAAIDLDVVQFQIMNQAHFFKLSAKMFQPNFASGGADALMESVERIGIEKGAIFRYF